MYKIKSYAITTTGLMRSQQQVLCDHNNRFYAITTTGFMRSQQQVLCNHNNTYIYTSRKKTKRRLLISFTSRFKTTRNNQTRQRLHISVKFSTQPT
jgi:hypothetical protein